MNRRFTYSLLDFVEWILLLFFLILFVHVLSNVRMFWHQHGRHHRILGGIHLCLLFFEAVRLLLATGSTSTLKYHVILGLSGVALTILAAYEFRKSHGKQKNTASATLQKTERVTVSEMKEHSFYQLLNLAQVLYIHFFRSQAIEIRFVGFLLVNAFWLARRSFPINRFSDNYTKGQAFSVYTVLYRIKKYQYVLWKHAVYNGINCAILLEGERSVDPSSKLFREFWLLLNTAYVMEFFLQSLVQKEYMKQQTMLVLNQGLMIIGSISGAILLIDNVNPLLVTFSTVLNFINRGIDFLNFNVVAVCGLLLQRMSSG